MGIGGRVVLVPAATKGIGLAIAQSLANEGARVAVVARTESDVKRIAQEIGGLGVAADVTTEEGCKRSVDETQQRLGQGDILINNFRARAGSTLKDTGAHQVQAPFRGKVT